ncbi:MAG: Txe/YoeB family addiction module toxin [Treponema sp.]|jgi:toxin YoeB|nr:Txe/YoeB family addiction module toxin [Treponema sp.]
MRITFANEDAFTDYSEWTMHDRKTAKKIMSLIKDIKRTPYSGLGKPEPLKYELSGYWSRHITHEHRLVYRIDNETIEILSCKYHYMQ